MSQSSLHAVIHLLRAKALVDERLSGELAAVHGLTLNEVLCLMHLKNAPRMRLTRVDIAKRLCVTSSSVTRMIAPLEKRGVIDRVPDMRDSRLVYAELTLSGEELATAALETVERMSFDLFRDRWTAEDIATLSKLLAQMTASLPGVV